jgi:hypothetical protein
MKTAYTDYPFDFLGDVPYQPAPVREIKVVGCAGAFDKYVTILVEGHETEIKAGYIYTKPGRYARMKFPRTHAGLYHD